MKEDKVQISYWQQLTMESGEWRKTDPISRKTAEGALINFEQGEIVELGGGK